MKKVSIMLVITLLCTMVQFTGAPSFAVADVTFSDITVASGLLSPMGIALGPDGKIYITEYGGGKITRMDKDGSNLEVFATGFTGPVGIVFDSDGNLLVSEHGGRKIKKISPTGTVTTVSTFSENLTGITLDSSGRIYVIGYMNGIIYRMNADGSGQTNLGTVSRTSAVGIAVDSNNNVYVSDRVANKIYKFKADGTKSDLATVSYPPNVSLGADGYLYASTNDSKIVKIDLSGNIVKSFAFSNHSIWGTYVDSNGGIYFTDNTHGTVNKLLGYVDMVDRTHLRLTMMYDLVSGAADPTAFTLTGIATNPHVTSAVVNGSTVDLTLDASIEYTDTSAKLSYTQTGTNDMVQQDTMTKIANFANLDVKNTLVGVSSVNALANINVDNGTALSSVSLPTSVKVFYSNSTSATVNITSWDGGTPAYNPNVAGTYTFKGTLDLDSSIRNPENKQATVSVTDAAPVLPVVTESNALSNITVSAGTAQSALNLPTAVTVKLNNSTTTSAAIQVWDNGTPVYDGNTAGTYVFSGTLASSADYLNSNSITASASVIVEAIPTVTTTSAINVITVKNGTDLNALNLPTAVTVGLNNSTTTSAAIQVWDNGTPAYDGNTAGTYVFTGTLATSNDYLNPSNLKASVSVVVSEKPTVSKADVIHEVTVENGTELSALNLPKFATVELSNSTTTSAAIQVWDNGTPTYDGNTAGTYIFVGTLAASNDFLNTKDLKVGAIVHVKAKSVVTPSIASVNSITPITVSNGTALSALGLPTTVTIELDNSTTTSAAIQVWDNGTPAYVGNTAGTYVFAGTLAASNDYTNDNNLKASIQVIVKAAETTTTTGGGGGSDKGSGGSSSGAATETAKASGSVKVNGEEKNVSTEAKTTENGKTKVKVAIDNTTLKKVIDEILSKQQTQSKNLVEIKVQDTTGDITDVGLNGDIVKQMEQDNFDILINAGDKSYKIPAGQLSVDEIAKELNVSQENLKSIEYSIQFEKVTSEEQTVLEKRITAKMLVTPTEFKIKAVVTKTDGTTDTVDVNSFNRFVTRSFEIPNAPDVSKITTGIVFDSVNGYSQVPTRIFTQDGKTYAEINSLTNSIYSVISNPITVSAVKGHWSEKIVNDMASRLILTDYSNFKADKNITRGELAAYMVKAMGMYRDDAAFEATFNDVKASDANARAIALASKWNLISGYEDGTFRADNEITREEAMVIFSKAMEIANYTGTTGASTFDINSYSNVPEWSKPYIKKALDGKIFVGRSANDLGLKENLTHSEALAAVRNLLIKAGLINN